MKLRRILAAMVAISIAPAGFTEEAVEVPTEEQEQEQRIEEIVVTARKREESAQDVPLAIQAFDSEAIEKYAAKIRKDVAKGKKRFGDSFNEEQFLATNPNVLRNQAKIDDIHNRFKTAMDNDDLPAVKELIEELGIADPETGSKN